MASIKVGSLEIISLLDLTATLPLNRAFPSVPAPAWAPYRKLYPKAIVNGDLRSPFFAFAIRAPDTTIMVDMGQGPGPFEFLGGARGNLPNELSKNGIDPDDVETVVFTHLHEDHTGWAVQSGKVLCPNAKHLAPKADWKALEQARPGFSQKEPLEALRDADKLELVSGDRQLTPEIRVVAFGGHTPGHLAVEIESGGEHAYICGDVVVTPAQLEQTDWAFVAELDPPAAADSRRRLIDRLERDQAVVGFAHFPPSGLGRIVREGDRRVFQPL